MEEKVEYGIIIRSFKTEEEAKRTMVNIYEEMQMKKVYFMSNPF